MKILIIEDELALSESIVSYLKSEKYLCETASTFNKALEKIETFDYDCILLDISLPDGNGLDILRELKKENKLDGVLVISAKNSLDDKIKGLTMGADDYLAKPFHLSELSARIGAIIRRKFFDGNETVQFNEISISTRDKTVYINKREIELTRKEYELLLYFISNTKRVISKTAIAEHLWGDEMDGNNDFIYTHIKNLRKKLTDHGANDYIKSIYGMGYKFSE